jgi:hypothetical protein
MNIHFNFKLKQAKPKVKVVVEDGVFGVVIVNANQFKVYCNKKLYNIAPESFSCKGKAIIYSKDKFNGQHYRIIRPVEHRCEMPGMYIPFVERVKVNGKIVSYNDNLFFRIESIDGLETLSIYNEILKKYE